MLKQEIDKDRTIILGKGFLGSEFERAGFQVWDRGDFEWPCELDVLAPYDYVVNCIGTANTRECEKPENWRDVCCVNVDLVKSLSEYCNANDKKFVHISSGCVYDDEIMMGREDGPVASHCKYVVSKLSAEYFCSPKDLIIRPRLFFSDVPHENNLLCKIPDFKFHLDVLNSFTSTRTIVEATEILMFHMFEGVVNVAQQGYSTILQLAMAMGLPPREIIDPQDLRENQGIHLVNCMMDINRLRLFYSPRPLAEEIRTCWERLKPNLNLDLGA